MSNICYDIDHPHTLLPLPDDCFVQMSVSNSKFHSPLCVFILSKCIEISIIMQRHWCTTSTSQLIIRAKIANNSDRWKCFIEWDKWRYLVSERKWVINNIFFSETLIWESKSCENYQLKFWTQTINICNRFSRLFY